MTNLVACKPINAKILQDLVELGEACSTRETRSLPQKNQVQTVKKAERKMNLIDWPHTDFVVAQLFHVLEGRTALVAEVGPGTAVRLDVELEQLLLGRPVVAQGAPQQLHVDGVALEEVLGHRPPVRRLLLALRALERALAVAPLVVLEVLFVGHAYGAVGHPAFLDLVQIS